MPFYNYQCFTCGAQEEIIGGLDDHVAHCTCGALMLRIDEDIFGPYFDGLFCRLMMLPPAPITSDGHLKPLTHGCHSLRPGDALRAV